MTNGHLFIINGDLTKIASDAILIPTDAGLSLTSSWKRFLREKTYQKHFDSQVMRALPGASKEPHIWLGNIGQVGSRAEFSVFEPTLREFVEKSVKELKTVKRADRIYAWPKLRLAIPFVGSGHGGAAAKKGQLAQGLVTTLDRLAADHGVDLILVTRGEKPYAAAQWARRQVVNDGALSRTWRFSDRANRGLVNCARRLSDAAIESHLVVCPAIS
jgi:hypothetical protein